MFIVLPVLRVVLNIQSAAPMIPGAVHAMLCVCQNWRNSFSCIWGDLRLLELAKRIDDSKAKATLTASCGVEPRGVIPFKRKPAAEVKLIFSDGG